MSGVFERGALLSLPGRELALTTPPASVFPFEALDANALSPALRRALELVAACVPPDSPRLIVARPEMFTDGATLAWLTQAIGGVADHVAFSDGETVRLIPGLRNHVYFYGLGRSGHLEALERLERRTPELLTQIDAQVNTALGFRYGNRRFAPPTQVLMADAPGPQPAPPLRGLVIDRHSLDSSVVQSLAAAPTAPGPFAQMHYLRLSENAFERESVARRVTALVADAMADAARAVVWILPDRVGDEAGRVGALLQCLRAGGGRLPLGPMTNVVFASADLDAATLGRMAARRTLVTDDLADVSRFAPEFLESFADTFVYARSNRHMPAQFHDLLRMVYGPRTQIDWLRSGGRRERGP